MAKTLTKQFSDRATFNAQAKTALSVRDGVLEYLGAELGPAFEQDRVYTVYRSPATIANAHPAMVGIPITDGHVDPSEAPPETGSHVADAEMVDATDPATATTIAIRNRLLVSDTMVESVASGKRELSLAYEADLQEHETYDFEQVNIKPHHLATVQQGRCGPMCRFLDRKPITQAEPQETNSMSLHKAFTDAEGSASLQQIVEIATALPEAIKTVPIEKIQEVLPALEELMSISKAVGVEDPDANADEDTPKDPDEDPEGDDMADEDKPKFSDADFKDAVDKEADKKAKEFADEAVKKHAFAIEKARDFVGEDYTFADKSTEQIMRDALATQSTEQFADSELELAFKLLKKVGPDYSQFGDQKPDENSLTARVQKRMEA